MISLLVTLEVDPQRVDEFLAHLTEEAVGVRAHEPACHRFEVSRSMEKPNVIGISEVYDDMAALEVHRAAPHYVKFRQWTLDEGIILNRVLLCGDILSV